MKFYEYLTELMNKKQLKFIAKKVAATEWMDDILSFIRKDRTYFSIDASNNKYIELTTRQNGDVANERPGKEDIQEARRLFKLLKRKFGKIAKIEIDTVDEWTMVFITKK